METEMEGRRQLFIIPAEVFKAISYDDIYKTAEDMTQLGIYKPPFYEFDVEIDAREEDIAKWSTGNEKVNLLGVAPDRILSLKSAYRYKFTSDWSEYTFLHRFYYRDSPNKIKNTFLPCTVNNLKVYYKEYAKNINRDLDEFANLMQQQINELSNQFLGMLIVLLATKNAEKECKKLSKHSILNRKSGYGYVTTIKIGKIIETYQSEGSSGFSVRPHMRRGHIRTQHFGVGNKEIKKIFIQPVFVNADEGWIENQRKAYKVTL